MKIIEIIELKRAVDTLSTSKTPIWYELGKNKVRIERIMESIIKPIMEDFNKARKLIIEQLSEKDEEGRAVTVDDKYVFK